MTMSDLRMSVPCANQNGTGCAAVLPTKLWYFFRTQQGASSSPTMILMRTTFSAAFVDAEAFLNPDAWAIPVQVEIPALAGYLETIAAGGTPTSNPVHNPVCLFALTVGQRIYLFWSDSSGRLMGSRSAGEDLWEPAFLLDGVTVAPGLSHAVSGYLFNGRLILAWIGVVDGNYRVLFNSFSEDRVAPNADGSGLVWSPDVAALMEGPGFTIHSTPTLAASWTVLPAAGSIGSTTTSVPVGFFASGTSTGQFVFCYELDRTTGLPTAPYGQSAIYSGTAYGSVLDLDASNTMFAYILAQDRQVSRRPLMDANGALRHDTASDTDADTAVISGGLTLTSYDIPQVAYVSGSQRQGELRTSDAPDAAVLATVATPLYQFIFSSVADTPSSIWVWIKFYGTRHVVTTVNELYHSDGSINDQAEQRALVVKGIIDGPLPVPGENLRMMSQGGTVSPWDLYKPIGKVTYGKNRTDNTTHQVTVSGMRGKSFSFSGSAGVDQEIDYSWSVGAEEGLIVEAEESEGGSLTAFSLVEMLGGRTDRSTQTTREKIVRTGQATVHESNVVGLTRVLPSGAASEDAPPILSDQAYIAGAALSVVCLAVAFEDPLRPGLLPARPSSVTLLPQTAVQLAAHYTADYAFTPGDLASYATDRIDDRMRTAYTNWRNANPGADDPFGDDYNDYFAKVIEPCALAIGGGGRRYLEISITNDGFTETKFDLTSFNFEEWGTTVDKSTYSAGTWENSVNVYGFEFKSYLESGSSFDFSAGYTDSTDRSERWGVSAELFNFPQATHSGHVSSYTLRVYFLPADNRWTQEVRCFSDYSLRADNATKPLDPNSRPWKIMFAVDPASIARMG